MVYPYLYNKVGGCFGGRPRPEVAQDLLFRALACLNSGSAANTRKGQANANEDADLWFFFESNHSVEYYKLMNIFVIHLKIDKTI